MMKKRISIIILFSIFLMWFSFSGFAHGLKLEVEKSFPCVQVAASYPGGQALTGAAVKIFFKTQETGFQQGSTDPNGKFSFSPDKAGTWLFQVDDGMGHMKTIKIEIDSAFFKSQTVQPPQSQTPTDTSQPGQSNLSPTAASKTEANDQTQAQPDLQKNSPKETGDGCIYCKILLGLAAIFLCTLLLYAWKRKSENKNKNNK